MKTVGDLEKDKTYKIQIADSTGSPIVVKVKEIDWNAKKGRAVKGSSLLVNVDPIKPQLWLWHDREIRILELIK